MELISQLSGTGGRDSNPNLFIWILVILAIFILGYSFYKGLAYGEAKMAFESDPGNQEKKETDLRLAKATSNDSPRVMETIQVLEAAQDRLKSKGKGNDFVADLERLQELRHKGALTQEEFELAKAKLLK